MSPQSDHHFKRRRLRLTWVLFTFITSQFPRQFPFTLFYATPKTSPLFSIVNLGAAESCRSDLACKNVSQSKQDARRGPECSKLP